MLRRGFSLMEMVAMLAIGGIVTAYAIKLSQSNATSDLNCYAQTRQQITAIQLAVDAYAASHNRLPMPSARNISDYEGYGNEAAPSAIDQTATTSIGALPYRALGLASSFAADCWGNKFTYFVSTSLTGTNASLNPANIGAISLKNGVGLTIYPAAAYAVISHGTDGYGAVKLAYSGSDKGWCSGTDLKSINCTLGDSVVDAPFNNGADADTKYYDDIAVVGGRPIVDFASLSPCALPWGGTLNSAQSVTAYSSSSGPCVSETRTCINGILSGSYSFESCGSAPPPLDCTITVGGVPTALAHGNSITRHQFAKETQFHTCDPYDPNMMCGSVCANPPQTAACNNGVITGTNPITYTKPNCFIQCLPPGFCTDPGDPSM